MSTHVLSLPKKAYLIVLSSGDREVVLVKDDPDRDDILNNKKFILIDGRRFNTSYIVFHKEININDEENNTAAWRTAKLSGWLKMVALERMRSYENSFQCKMPLKKLMEWMTRFISCARTRADEWDETYKKYMQIFIESWWDPNTIS